MSRAVVTEAETTAASALVSDWLQSARFPDYQPSPSARGVLRAMIAAALADAREGATIPGERHDVQRVMDVSVRQWQDVLHHPAHFERLRERLRADWARGLESSGLQPLGWPPVTASWLRCATDQPWTVVGAPWVECDEADAELLRLSIRGQAVAL